MWPKAVRLEHVADASADFVFVASPAGFHADQSIEAMEAGLNVFCEKPMSSTCADAERMIAASRRSDKLLAIGLFRRFFPASLAIRDMVANRTLGQPLRYRIAEGGPFGWPAASATFFQKQHAFGGVLHDLGVHALDLVLHWFGEATEVEYADDAAGGLETNCLVRLKHASGLEGEVRLSRDWNTANRYFIEFERGWIGFSPAKADELEFGLRSCVQVDKDNQEKAHPLAYRMRVCELAQHWGLPSAGTESLTYHQCFTEQLAQFMRAINREEPVFVPGEEGIRSLRLIEQCYANRKEMALH